jgi:hypothetical protein
MMDDNFICYACEMSKYPNEKLDDPAFMKERKEEFYPSEEYGECVEICENCMKEMAMHYLEKLFFK